MAVVNLSHNITRQEDFEGAPGGTIGSTGGGPAAVAEAGLHYEASQCLARRIGGSNSDRGFDYDHSDIGTVNMYNDGFQIWLCKVFTALSAVINPAGTEVGIGDADGSMYRYQVGDDGTMGDSADFSLPPKGGYVLIPIEARVNAWHNEGRETTPDISVASVVELIHNVSATTGAGTSQAMDSIDYTTDGLFLVGGDSTDPDGTFADFVDADEGSGLSGAGRAGLWASSPAGFLAFLTNVIGRTDTGTSTLTVFTDSGFVVVFPGGFVSEGRNGIEFDLDTNNTTIDLSDGSISGSDRGFGGRSKIKRYFDTEFDVNATTDQISISSHGLFTGDAVIYSAEGGTEDIGPDATNGEAEFNTAGTIGTGAYSYVIKVDDNNIQLASTAQNAYASTPTEVALTASTAGNGENHSFTRAPDTRPNIEFTYAGTATGVTATLNRVNLTKTRIITLQSVATLTSCVISEGRQLILNNATLDSCIIARPTTSIGEAYMEAINANDLDSIDDCSFTSGGLGHAIEITTDGGTAAINTSALSNVSFTDYFTGDGDNTGGVGFNASTGVSSDQITFDANHSYTTGDPIYYSDEGGTAITGLTDQSLYFVEVVDVDTVYVHASESSASNGASGNRITLTAGSSETHKFYSANAAIFNNTGADVTINVLNGGSTPSIRNGAGSTTTVNNAVNITISSLSEGAAVKTIADETVGTITSGDVLNESLADSSGNVSFSLNYEAAFDPSGLDVIVRARQQGLPNAAIADDGGVFTDETTNANSATTDDVNLLPASPVANDAYYFGHAEEFPRIKIDITDGNGTGSTITWEYWNGSSWTALSGVTDGTSNFENVGENIVSWTVPGDWTATTVNSQGPYKYVRARLSTLGSANQTRARKVQLDVTRYIPFVQNRTITGSGLDVVASWNEDTIAKFTPTD